MSFTPGTPNGQYSAKFIRYVDATYPDSPLWADSLDIKLSFSMDSNNTPIDAQQKMQDEIDALSEALAPLEWVFVGASVTTQDGTFTLTPPE